MKTEFLNNQEGRQELLREIHRLQSDGFKREDVQGLKVILSKIILQGKICTKNLIIEFVYDKDSGKIKVVQDFDVRGVEEAKGKLYGFASGIIEATNAVRSGLFSSDDYDILASECFLDDWWICGVRA